MAAKKQTRQKLRKKVWVQFVAPKLFNNVLLGESPVYEPQELVGRHIQANLMTLTNDVKKQSITLKFRATKVVDSKLATELVSFSLNPASIKRMIGRGISRIDESFIVKTSDGKLIRIKAVLVTYGKASSVVLKNLRRNFISHIIRDINKLGFEDFVSMAIGQKFQVELKKRLNKIFPIKSVEIKNFEVVNSGEPLKLTVVQRVREKEEQAEEPVKQTDDSETFGEEN